METNFPLQELICGDFQYVNNWKFEGGNINCELVIKFMILFLLICASIYILIKFKGKTGWSTISFVSAIGNEDAIRLLIELGADLNYGNIIMNNNKSVMLSCLFQPFTIIITSSRH